MRFSCPSADADVISVHVEKSKNPIDEEWFVNQADTAKGEFESEHASGLRSAFLVSEGYFLYIFAVKSPIQRILPTAKRFAIVSAVLVILFFIFDDIVMPRYVRQGETTTVPNVVGLKLDDALKTLSASGLNGKGSEIRPDKQYPEGAVAAQTPFAGDVVKFGRGIYLTISGGETLNSVPGLRGKSVRDAALTLERFGLKLGDLTYQVSTEFPENTIIEQSIAEGTNVKAGMSISVIASQGPSADRLPVPNVVRKSLVEAQRLIQKAGLTVGNITFQVNNELLPNTVIDQYPRGGGFALASQAIDLFVAQKAEQKKNLEN